MNKNYLERWFNKQVDELMGIAKGRVYVSGKIAGLPEQEWKGLFSKAANKLRYEGYSVINPAENPPRENWEEYMKYDIEGLVHCDYIAVLPNWKDSRGARIEVKLARELKIPVVEWDTFKPVEDHPNILEEANHLVNGPRQASYGHPFDDYKCVADMFTAFLRKKYGYNFENLKQLEPADMIVSMQMVKISREANSSKRDNMVDLAGYAECLWMVRQREAQQEIKKSLLQEPEQSSRLSISLSERSVSEADKALNDFRETRFKFGRRTDHE